MAHNPRYNANNEKYGYKVCIEKNLSSGNITKNDTELIEKYVLDVCGDKDIENSTIDVIYDRLIAFRRFMPCEYQNTTLESFKAARRALNTGLNTKGRPYSQNTRRDMLKRAKSFIKWLSKKGYIANIDADDLKKIEVPETDFNSDSPDDLYTYDDVKAMIAKCQNSRDRAFIITMYETGARPVEIASLVWRDVTLNKQDAKIIVTDAKRKTLKRTAYVVQAMPYLLSYRNDRGDVKPDDFVFVDRSGQPMTRDTARKILETVMKRAAIGKPCKLKLFRKSRITNMSKENYNESVIRDQIWGNQNTGDYGP